jgi:hypothetical protein
VASAQLRDTRRRIKSVEATKKITRAMELIAASRIPKAQARVHGSQPYTAKLIEVIENVGGTGGGRAHSLLERREVKNVGLLIVSSDRGMAGAYASSVHWPASRFPHLCKFPPRSVLMVSAYKDDFARRQFGDQPRTIRGRYPPFVVVESVEKVAHECHYVRFVTHNSLM